MNEIIHPTDKRSLSQKSLADYVLVTPEQFNQSFRADYRYKQSLDTLAKYDITFPLTLGHKKFTVLAALGNLVDASGNLRRDAMGNYSASITKGKGYRIRLNDYWDFYLGLGMRNSNLSFDFNKNGGAYARLLALIGFNLNDQTLPLENLQILRNTKAQGGFRFAPFLVHLINNYGEFSLQEKRLANPILNDLVRIYFATRGKGASFITFKVNLISQYDESSIKEQGRQLISAINSVCHSPLLTEKNLETYLDKKRSGLIRGDILIPLERFPANIPIRVSMRPKKLVLSFMHPHSHLYTPNPKPWEDGYFKGWGI